MSVKQNLFVSVFVHKRLMMLNDVEYTIFKMFVTQMSNYLFVISFQLMFYKTLRYRLARALAIVLFGGTPFSCSHLCSLFMKLITKVCSLLEMMLYHFNRYLLGLVSTYECTYHCTEEFIIALANYVVS